MVIIVYASETRGSISANIGTEDYSYYFVLEKYCRVLRKFATVIEVRDPLRQVDPLYEYWCARKVPCLFLSFTPPFKTAIELKCPTLSVFAWEYTSIPTDEWSANPLNDWRRVFRKHGRAITHSTFAVRVVRQAMGADFPIWSIPAPVWDDYVKLQNNENYSPVSSGFELNFEGLSIDFRGCDSNQENAGSKPAYQEQRSCDTNDRCVKVHLQGIIYTSVFNPNDGRKNWMDLLWAFCWAFREVEDATLVMKLVYHDFDFIRDIVLYEIMKLAPFKCRVVILHGYLDGQNYAKLIQESTYIVNTAHGEGQCLPLMEYMSAGKPAVAPNHTAMKDYINHDNAFIVQSSLEWFHWPHDPRTALRTFRYRINWESLHQAYLQSYHVAKYDPSKYRNMSIHASQSLQRYCSAEVVEAELKRAFETLGREYRILPLYNPAKLRQSFQLLKVEVKKYVRGHFNIGYLVNLIRTMKSIVSAKVAKSKIL